jgi:ABC-2 type transport system permease protein
MLTFAMYPSDIFQGAIRFLLLTLLPAALVGVMPLSVVRGLDVGGLAVLAGAAAVTTAISAATFYIGLRRYESGSAINVNV